MSETFMSESEYDQEASRLTLEIELVNEAFQGDKGPGNLADLLREIAESIEDGLNHDIIVDANGNHIGEYTIA